MIRVESSASLPVVAPAGKVTNYDVGTQEPVKFFNPFKTDKDKQQQDSLSQEIEEKLIHDYVQQQTDQQKPFDLSDVVPLIHEGFEAIVKDNFTGCFMPKPPEPWDWNVFLFSIWLIGLLFRYLILLPLRLTILLVGTLVFMCTLPFFAMWKDESKKRRAFSKVIQFYALIWMVSLNAVVKVHGSIPKWRKRQIYVANHTSLIDFIILCATKGFASVGQHHVGFVGYIQDKIITPLGNIWFERFEAKDRSMVAKRIIAHIDNEHSPPLLIFPEGVCVNNEYCVMFKKGVFEIEDAEICPIAIRYNKMFADPYWSSKDESFISHVLRLMKSWCLVCDVYFLEPQKKSSKEDATAFSNRVKKMIARKARLINVPWDGYLKYYRPSKRFSEQKQKVFADMLIKKYLTASSPEVGAEVEVPNSASTTQNAKSKLTHRPREKPNSHGNTNSNDNDRDGKEEQ